MTYTTNVNHGLPESVDDLWWEYVMVGKYCKRKSDSKLQENTGVRVFRLTKIRFNSEPAQIRSRSNTAGCSLCMSTHTEPIENIIYTHKHLSCHSALEPHKQK